MAVTYPIQKNGMYYGRMDDNIAKLILNTREQKKVEGLTKKIFNFPMELITKSLDTGVSIREIIRDGNIDYTDYIGELRDYQTVGTAFMYLSKRSMIGDRVGLGKTAQVAALINVLKERGELIRFLMAVETSAFKQTQYEMVRFTGLNIIILPSESNKIEKAIKNTDWSKVDGVIIKHSALRSDVLSRWLARYLDNNGKSKIFNTFILDESSAVKNPSTKIFQYTSNLCNIIDRVHFMNATVFETSIMDIYYQMDMLDNQLLPKKWRIEKEYCTFGYKQFWVSVIENGTRKPKMKYSRQLSNYKNQKLFKESLKLVYLGRSKEDVGMDIPHIYKVYEVEPTSDQLLAINKGYRYMEVLNCPSLVSDAKIEFNRDNVPKLDRLVQLIETEFAEDKVMIYCFHIEAQVKIAKALEEIGRNPVIVNGEDTDEKRWGKINSFNHGDRDVIITNIKKSLNLQAGSVCIFYSMEGNPAKLEQIKGRIDRNVDNNVKTFILLVYKGTDEYKFLTQVVKRRSDDSRALTIDAKTTIDYFIEYMQEN